MTKAVIFDAGNTLLKVRSSVGDVYSKFAGRFGVEVDGAMVNLAFKKTWSSYRNSLFAYSMASGDKGEKAWWQGLVSQVFESLGLKEKFGSGFDSYFELLYHFFAQPENWEVFDDVWPALDLLSMDNIRLAVLSNWDSRLHTIIKEVNLSHYFEFVLTSAEFGKEKPHPDIFHHALKLLHVLPSEAIYVGDLYHDDILGASNAGLLAVMIDREGHEHNNHLSISVLSDLPALIRKMAAS